MPEVLKAHLVDLYKLLASSHPDKHTAIRADIRAVKAGLGIRVIKVD